MHKRVDNSTGIHFCDTRTATATTWSTTGIISSFESAPTISIPFVIVLLAFLLIYLSSSTYVLANGVSSRFIEYVYLIGQVLGLFIWSCPFCKFRVCDLFLIWMLLCKVICNFHCSLFIFWLLLGSLTHYLYPCWLEISICLDWCIPSQNRIFVIMHPFVFNWCGLIYLARYYPDHRHI